jgi:site-specific DNA-methyltransferase (adenine-specific)
MKKQNSLIKQGDIFRIGEHLLACGDARDKNLVDRLIGKEKIKLVLSDPPYGCKLVEGKEGFANLKVNKKILNDDITSESEYILFTKDWLTPIIAHLANKNSTYIFGSDVMALALREGMQNVGLRFGQMLIWIKNHPVIGRKDFLPMHEIVMFGWKGSHEFKRSKDKSVIYCPKPNRSPLHPTQKPVSLLRRFILNSSNIGDIVWDSFAGSGSLGIAAQQTGRRSIMIERDEEYCQTIINRFERVFGLKAELL